MPELPEVEVARLQLERWAAGQVLKRFRVEDPGVVRPTWSTSPRTAVPDPSEALQGALGATAATPIRRGKRIGWHLGELGLGLHLGMTGRLLRRTDDVVPRFGRLGLHIGDRWIWLDDSRRFGCVVPVSPSELPQLLAAGIGPDALLDPLDGPGLGAVLRSRRPIKVALMDQTKIAGIGNIHAVEALFRARIAPQLRAVDLDAAAWDRLARVLPAQLRQAVADTDGDEVDYVTAGGPNPFAVYNRAGEPCLRCEATVEQTRQAGRATFWCPRCQV